MNTNKLRARLAKTKDPERLKALAHVLLWEIDRLQERVKFARYKEMALLNEIIGDQERTD